MKEKKSTNRELVAELQARNTDGKFDQLIQNAINNHYHDYKNPEDVTCGKLQFISDTQPFALELQDLRQQILNGEYDESPDAEDLATMRGYLLEDGSPDALFKEMGFPLPSEQERKKHKK